MEFDLNLIQCNKCGKVREKFLVGCPNCGVIENTEVDSENDHQTYKPITLDVIKRGSDYYKKEMMPEQRQWFKERIPNGQSWQFYAGILLANKLNMLWLRGAVKTEIFWLPLATIHSRVYYIMSFMSQEKQQLFCDLLNTFSHERLMNQRDAREGNQEDLQGEIRDPIQDTPTD